MADPLNLSPVLRERAITLYNRMHQEAEEMEDGRVVWTGAFVKLTQSMGIATGSYQKIRQRLEDTGCIMFIQRGNGMQASVILLQTSPDEVEWSKRNRKDLTRTVEGATMRQELDDLRKRIGTLDVVQALIALTEENKSQEQKIRKLELRIRRLAVKLGIDPKEVEVD